MRAWFDGPLALSGAIATGAACSPRRRWALISPISARPSSPPKRPARARSYKQAIVEGRAEDIVGSNLFTGVFGNYLQPPSSRRSRSRQSAAKADVRRDFASSDIQAIKAWRDIWGSGQGIGAVDAVVPARELVARLMREYAQARGRLQR